MALVPLLLILRFCEAHDAFEVACEDRQCCLHRHIHESVRGCSVETVVLLEVGILGFYLVPLTHLVSEFLGLFKLDVVLLDIRKNCLCVGFL